MRCSAALFPEPTELLKIPIAHRIVTAWGWALHSLREGCFALFDDLVDALCG
jgi:hypothetical protein